MSKVQIYFKIKNAFTSVDANFTGQKNVLRPALNDKI
jgi:hypothetical protein